MFDRDNKLVFASITLTVVYAFLFPLAWFQNISPPIKALVAAFFVLAVAVVFFVSKRKAPDAAIQKRIRRNIDQLAANNYQKLAKRPTSFFIPPGAAVKKYGRYLYVVNEKALNVNPHNYVKSVKHIFYNRRYEVGFSCATENKFEVNCMRLNKNLHYIVTTRVPEPDEVEAYLMKELFYFQGHDFLDKEDIEFARKLIAAQKLGLTVEDMHNIYFHPDGKSVAEIKKKTGDVPLQYIKAIYGLPEHCLWLN